MIRFVLAAALCAASVAPACATPITTYPDNVVSWNVGSGQSNGNFVVTRDTGPGGTLELGLRAQERFVGPTYTPVSAGGLAGGMYIVQAGESGPNRAKWNFDFSVSYPGKLVSASLSFEALTPGLTPLIPAVPLGVSGNPVLTQDSSNPGFVSLTPYDANVTGIYRITLTATPAGGDSVSNSILVNIGGVPLPEAPVPTPEPATLLVFGALGCVAFGARFRRKAVA